MILVTGASGRIGRATARLLVEEYGLAPRVLARDPGRARGVLPAGVDFYTGDFADPTSLVPALDGVDKVLLNSPAVPEQVEWQGNLVRAAPPAAHIVKISGLGTGLASYVSSGRRHAQTEEAIRRSGRPHTFLRPYCFLQNLAFQFDSARRHGEIRSGVGEARIAMVDVEDIAAVAARLLAGKADLKNRARPLTGPAALGYAEIAAAFTDMLGRRVVYRPQSLDEVRHNLAGSGQPRWRVELMLEFNRAFSEGLAAAVDPTVPDVLGRPARSLRQYLDAALGSPPAGGDENPFPS